MRTSLALLFGVVITGCSGGQVSAPPDLGAADVIVNPDTEGPTLDPGTLAIRAVEPDHGPYTGGTQVIVRGVAFPESSVVFFDGNMVEPLYQQWLDPTRIMVLTPGGAPGPADVTIEASVGDGGVVSTTLAGGFVYDAFYVDPPTGPELGGTAVTIHGQGTAFVASTTVMFGDAPLEDLVIVSDNQITGSTPPGTEGPVDVTVATADGTLEVRDGFTYYPGVSLAEGGLGGGEIEEALNVTVVDYSTGAPVAGAFVIVGADPTTPHQGLTDAFGSIVFTGTFTPPVDLSASAAMYESTSMVSFNAREAVIRLIFLPPPTPGPPPPGPYGAYVSGVIQFGDASGIGGTNVWTWVPEPANDDQSKCAKVQATIPNLYGPQPNPGTGTHVPYDPGRTAWRYRIFVRPGVMAIYAMAGICDVSTGTEVFTPYALGIQRGVVASPGDGIVADDAIADIVIDTQLNQFLDVSLSGVSPLATSFFGRPARHFLSIGIDLGGDGILLREDSTVIFQAGGPLQAVVPAQAPLVGPALWDASYVLVGGAESLGSGPISWPEAIDRGSDGVTWYIPFSTSIKRGVTDISGPIVVDGFVGMPEMTNPTPYSYIINRHLAWIHEGAPPPEMSLLLLQEPGLFGDIPVWRMFVEGSRTSVDIPNLPTLAGLPDLPFQLNWSIWNIKPSGGDYDFNSLAYRDALSYQYYDAYAIDRYPVYYTP